MSSSTAMASFGCRYGPDSAASRAVLAKTALLAALSGPYLHPKLAIAVDDDIDASDLRQVMWSMTTRVHAERDVVMIPNSRVFPLDNSSPVVEGQSTLHRPMQGRLTFNHWR